jgi:hypothetical protein
MVCLTKHSFFKLQSHPLGRQEWLSPSGRKIIPGSKDTPSKYFVKEQKTYSFKVVYRLTINKVDHSDAGECEMSQAQMTSSRQ